LGTCQIIVEKELFHIMRITSLTLVTLFVLSACTQAVTAIPSPVTVENPTSTKSIESPTPTPSLTPWPSQTPYPTLTQWIKVYPTKKALVVYGTSWRNEYTGNFIEYGDFYMEPYLVLYEDGQLIFGIGDKQNQLSQQDTKAILTKLEELGFSQLQNTYAADTDNPLYNFPNQAVPDPNLNLPSVVVTVNGKEIRYMEEWENYLVQPMKDIISYLDSISSVDTTPYEPDRLLIGFVSEEGKRIPEDTVIIPWPPDVTPPSHRSYMGVLYLEGEDALRLYKAAGESLYEYFSFDGKKYNVYLRPILPHECHIYHLYEETPPTQPYFTCDDW
jgi:hypothetical protein